MGAWAIATAWMREVHESCTENQAGSLANTRGSKA